MVLRLLEQGIEVVAWNRSLEPLAEVEKAGAVAVDKLEGMMEQLKTPRMIWVMLPAGEVTEEFIDKVSPMLSPGDLLIDGGNSFYKDSIRRAEKLSLGGIKFLDIGVSGGPEGARNGACLMVGGAKEDFERVLEVIKAASAPDAYALLGPVGAGHFAKMVHNGIEYGMMEAIAEGFAILSASPFNFDLARVAQLYNRRSVIESRLVNWAKEALEEDPRLESYSSKIGHTGEGEWTAKTAKELGVEAPIIQKSFDIRVESETEPDNIRNRVVSAMRGKFGGHPVKKS